MTALQLELYETRRQRHYQVLSQNDLLTEMRIAE